MPPITQKIDRARQELGFEPTGFSDGLAETFQWYQRQEDRPAEDFSWEEKLLAGLAGS
jgi:dTDP-D-glucose 4,6-dehydratase